MKIFCSLVFALLLLYSCSDKYSSLYGIAPSPALTFNRDTLVIREKDYDNINGTNNGRLVFYCNFYRAQMNLLLTDTSNQLQIRYRGQLLHPLQPLIVANDSTVVSVICAVPGTYQLDVLLTDQLGKMIQKALVIECLPNAKPLVVLNDLMVDSSVFNNWVYELDAGGSTDTDGRIMQFHFDIDGTSFTSVSSFVRWVFHARGEHTIKLFAEDDMRLYSDTLVRKIIIP